MLYPVFLIFAILQSSFAFPASPTETFLNQLTSALPLKGIQELKDKHAKSDPGFQAAITLMQSPEWKAMVEQVHNTPQWIEYKSFVKESGIDVDYLVQHLHHCIKGTNVAGANVSGVKPSLTNFIDDVRMTYGIDILKGMQGFLENLGKNAENSKLKEQLKNPKAKELLVNAMKQPALVEFKKKLLDVGINVDDILELINGFLEKA